MNQPDEVFCDMRAAPGTMTVAEVLHDNDVTGAAQRRAVFTTGTESCRVN